MVAGIDSKVINEFHSDDFQFLASATSSGSVVINELQVSTTGADFEFVELFGMAGLDLAGYSLIEVEGDSTKGRINSVNTFSGALDDNGFHVRLNAQGEATYGVTSDVAQTSQDFQNGTGTYLLVRGFTGAAGDDLDIDDDGSLDTTPWSSIVDSVALTDGDAGDVTYSANVRGPDGSFLPAGVFRAPDGGDFAERFLNFSTPDGTPGAANPSPEPAPVPGGQIAFNEIRIASSSGNPDTDFIELIATPGLDLSAYTVLAIEAETFESFAPGSIRRAYSLEGGATDDEGIFVLTDTNVALDADEGDIVNADLDLINSPQTLLVVNGFTGMVGDDLDADDDGVIDNAPWTDIVAAIGLLDNDGADVTYASENVGPSGNFTPAVIARDPDATGAFVIGSFSDVTGDSAGALNIPEAGPAIEATIMQIQGAAHTSPLLDEIVLTSGIVTAVGSNGFYLQDADGDGNIATSDAIFVFTGGAPGIAAGDEAQVRGTVSEFFPGGAATGNLGTTQVSASEVAVLSSGNALPAAIVLGEDRIPPSEIIDDDDLASFDPALDGVDFFESLEAMLVTVNDPLAVAGTNRFGEIYTVADNGSGATNLSSRGTINVRGDGTNLGTTDIGPSDDYNPERIQIDADSTITPGSVPDVATGTLLNDVTGVISYDFGNYQVVPTSEITVAQESTLEREITQISGAENTITIASYNVLNLDPNDSEADPGERDTDVADGRFFAIASDIVAALGAPDIVALQEVQDNNGADIDDVVSASQTLQMLADEIAAAGGPRYEFIDNPFITANASGGQPGGNIRTAFLYNPDRVDLLEGSVASIEAEGQATNPDNPFFDARLPLVATFAFDGAEYTVVNNHFSSKGGSTPLFGTVQPPINGSADERFDQATAIAGFASDLIAAGRNVVVLGDFNEFEYEDPLDPLYAASLVNLTNRLPEEERYTFTFDGNSQSLDHIFVSPDLALNSEFDIVHVNTEFAANETASDHDPLIVGISTRSTIDAQNDFASTVSPEAVTFDLVANDVVEDDGDLAITALGTAANGMIVDNGDGTVTYTPDPGFTGADTFTYTVTGDDGDSDSAVVTVDVDAAPGDGGMRITGSENDDRLIGDATGGDNIVGGAGSDFLAGLGGSDVIRGALGVDFLTGGEGNDVIVGGLGQDFMNGGFGNDIFVFAEGETAATAGEADQITDFGLFGEDVLDLSRIDAVEGGEDDTFTFIGDAAFSGAAGELRVQSNGAYTDLFGDTDGDGTADFAIRLLGDIELSAAALIA